MLTHFIEHLLMLAFNRWRQRRDARPALALTAPVAAPADYVVLGHRIDTAPTLSLAVAEQLTQAGIIALSPEARRRHLYILGATGTGKTNLLLHLIESDIKHQHAFCVVDLRGDLVDRILLRLAQSAPAEAWRERLLLLDLRHEECITGFNPLLGEGDAYNRALHVLSVLKCQAESWGIQLEETLRNCLIALAESGWSLLEIEPLLTNAGFRAQVLAQISDTHVRHFFERYEQLPTASQLAWTLPVLNKVTPLTVAPQLRLTLSQRHSIPFRQLLDQQPGMIMLVSLAVDRFHDAARLMGALFVSAFQAAIMSRVDQAEKDRVPAHLYVDEFEAMATDRFEAIVAEGRRFGLGLCLSHQNINQLSTGLRHVLRNNVQTQVYFQTGALDAAELAKEIAGGESREEIRTTLMTQGMGEAYLVRRGQASLRMRTLHCPDPQVTVAAVKSICATSWATYAQPRAALEGELAEREQAFRQVEARPESKAKSNGGMASYAIYHAHSSSHHPEDVAPKLDFPPDPKSVAKPVSAAKLKSGKRQAKSLTAAPTGATVPTIDPGTANPAALGLPIETIAQQPERKPKKLTKSEMSHEQSSASPAQPLRRARKPASQRPSDSQSL